MDAQELVRCLESGDLYGLMLRVNRAWLSKDHPGAGYAAVVVHIADGVPDLRVPITSPSAASHPVPAGPPRSPR